MKIGVNLIQYIDLQGIEIFIKNILAAWPRNDNTEIVLFTNQKSALIFKDLSPQFKIISHTFSHLTPLHLILFQQFRLPRLLRQNKIDLLLCPSLSLPLFFRRKKVIIHDLAICRYPKESGLFGRLYLRLAILSAKYFSLGLAAVSEFAKQEISALLKIKASTIPVIGEGVPALPKLDLEFSNTAEAAIAKTKIPAGQKYFLYIGNIRPRKNLPRLITAFQIFSTTHPDYRLVIAGKRDKNSRTLEKSIIEPELKEKIIFSGFVSDEEKVHLIKGGRGLVFISLYEGFGLPILEAQALETPVLSAAVSALPETAGPNGALFADPLNIKDIAAKLEIMAEDEEKRQKLIVAGKENLKRYSWEKSAKNLQRFLGD